MVLNPRHNIFGMPSMVTIDACQHRHVVSWSEQACYQPSFPSHCVILAMHYAPLPVSIALMSGPSSAAVLTILDVCSYTRLPSPGNSRCLVGNYFQLTGAFSLTRNLTRQDKAQLTSDYIARPNSGQYWTLLSMRPVAPLTSPFTSKQKNNENRTF
jgi:hypothetical protein